MVKSKPNVKRNINKMKNSAFYVLIAFSVIVMAYSCSPPTRTKTEETKIQKPVNESKVEPEQAEIDVKKFEGTWSSSEAKGYGIETVEIIKDGNSYKAVLSLIDGSSKTEHLSTKKENGVEEYHTNNRFGEYYKLNSYGLGSYDNDGIIFTLYKSN